ncbi:TonB-dependent receptor [Phytopseudomonas daroniae]|uniref:TonB-dependent receptor n=1 Tax=Phytopseudomonas daroniae TaxID=2487519 RepID=UPI0010385B27|nr:TonB-dependent receptor [Pseudomonas daroniae]TBU72206.1 TonB-dependent siderophore receptor [Pseudomonas daroniae]
MPAQHLNKLSSLTKVLLMHSSLGSTRTLTRMGLLTAMAVVPHVQAQEWRLNIPAQPLAQALQTWAHETGVQLLYNPGDVQGLHSTALNGSYPLEGSISRLIQGTGLSYTWSGNTLTLLGTQGDQKGSVNLAPAIINADSIRSTDLAQPYAGGQVARGSKIGLLGNQDIFDTPFSVTSYTSELMENQQARTIADVILNDPSTHLVNPSQGVSEAFSIRGFNIGGNGADLYDGLPSLAHRRRSTIDAVERVEVFKGPNALLTGATASVGGTINLVPKRPLEESLTRLTTSYESDAKGGVHADISRRFGDADQFGARLNSTFRDGESSFEDNKENLKNLSLALDTRTEKFRASAIFDYSDQLLKGGNQIFTATAVPSAPDTSKAIQQPWEKVDSQFKRGLVRAEYDILNNWTINAAYGATDYQSYWLRTIGTGLDAAGNYNQIAQQQSDEYTSQAGSAGIRGNFRTGSITHNLVIETLASSSENSRLSVNVPGYSVASSLYTPVSQGKPSYAYLTRNPPKTDETLTESTAIADTLGFFDDRVLLTAGVRRQRVKLENFSTTTGARNSKYDEAATTPAFALLVKPTQYLSLYGNYIESLESGPTAPTTTVNAGEVFPPSKTKQIELGAKFDFGEFGLTTGVFQIDRPSGMIDANNRYTADAEQRNRGVEVSAFGAILPELRLLGGVTYIDSELTKTQGGAFDGNKGIGVPELSAVLGFEWDTPLVNNLTLTGRANYTDRQYMLSDNSQSIPSYTIYGIGARYKTRVGAQDVTLRANVDNLFGKDYWATFVGSPGILYLGAPRQFKLSMTIDL